jgi:hypothetical protein
MCTTEDQSPSASGVVNLQSVKSGSGVSKPTTDLGCPLPSSPWHDTHAVRYSCAPVIPERSEVCAASGAACVNDSG